jgi:hypothetical protein
MPMGPGSRRDSNALSARSALAYGDAGKSVQALGGRYCEARGGEGGTPELYGVEASGSSRAIRSGSAGSAEARSDGNRPWGQEQPGHPGGQ